MTAPFEIEEPEPIEASHLLAVGCSRRCGRRTVAAPDQTAVALCGPCRTAMTLQVASIQRLPDVPPPSVEWVGSGDSGPENGAERVEVVAPEMVCPMPCDHDMPKPVQDLVQLSMRRGWLVAWQHSRGGVMGGAGKQLAPAEMWGVRFRRGAWQGYAVRRGDAWDSVCIAGEKLHPFLALGVTDLRTWLADPDQDQEWYDKIRGRVAGAALASKVVRCPGPGECALDLVRLAFVPLRMVMGSRQMAPIPDHTHRGDGAIKIKNSRAERKTGA